MVFPFCEYDTMDAYPQQNPSAVELCGTTNRPINFRLSSSARHSSYRKYARKKSLSAYEYELEHNMIFFVDALKTDVATALKLYGKQKHAIKLFRVNE